jgi:nucleotide-binding universal stress UspA family protein
MKIFLPTDFSKQSGYAEQVAVAFAKMANAEIHLFHSVKTPVDWKKISTKDENKYPEAKKQISDAKVEMDAFATKHKEIKVTRDIGYNLAHEDIPMFAEKEKADLIIMGGHGESGYDEEHLGSHSRKVLRNTRVPLLLIRKKPAKTLPLKIIVTSDFDEKSVKELRKVADTLSFLKPDLHLLFVNSPLHFQNSDETEKQLHKAAKLIGVTPSHCHIFNYRFIEDGIQRFCELKKADAVVFISKSKKSFLGGLNYSYTENTAEMVDVPVFVFKA